MRKLRIIQLILLLFTAGLSSCGEEAGTKTDLSQYTNLGAMLQRCKGHAVVKAKGFNDGAIDTRKYLIIVVDDSLNCFEYAGAKFDIEVGDTLK